MAEQGVKCGFPKYQPSALITGLPNQLSSATALPHRRSLQTGPCAGVTGDSHKQISVLRQTGSLEAFPLFTVSEKIFCLLHLRRSLEAVPWALCQKKSLETDPYFNPLSKSSAKEWIPVFCLGIKRFHGVGSLDNAAQIHTGVTKGFIIINNNMNWVGSQQQTL